MAVREWRVIVVRVWHETDGVRVRILCDDADADRRVFVTDTAAEAGAIVQRLVADVGTVLVDDVTVVPPRP